MQREADSLLGYSMRRKAWCPSPLSSKAYARRGPLKLGADVPALDPGVAATRGCFETLAIEDSDLTAAVADQVALLEKAGGRIHRAAPHPEHVSQERLRKEKFLR